MPVKGQRVGVTDNISHAVGALQKLWQWDGRHPKVKKAVDVCSAYMEGLAKVEDARASFEAAAKATGNLMPRV